VGGAVSPNDTLAKVSCDIFSIILNHILIFWPAFLKETLQCHQKIGQKSVTYYRII
jgi:hypothetical protein